MILGVGDIVFVTADSRFGTFLGKISYMYPRGMGADKTKWWYIIGPLSDKTRPNEIHIEDYRCTLYVTKDFRQQIAHGRADRILRRLRHGGI